MVRHLLEVWLLIAAAFGAGGVIGMLFYRAVAMSGYAVEQRQLAAAIARRLDRLRGRALRQDSPGSNDRPARRPSARGAIQSRQGRGGTAGPANADAFGAPAPRPLLAGGRGEAVSASGERYAREAPDEFYYDEHQDDFVDAAADDAPGLDEEEEDSRHEEEDSRHSWDQPGPAPAARLETQAEGGRLKRLSAGAAPVRTQSNGLGQTSPQPAMAERQRDPGVAPRPAGPKLPEDAKRPLPLKGLAVGVPDDLKRIRGIGKANEAKLHEIGIFRFHQIASWSESEQRWVSAYLGFAGRVEREEWVRQAAALLPGPASTHRDMRRIFRERVRGAYREPGG